MWTITRKYGVTNHLPFSSLEHLMGQNNSDYKRPLLNGKYISVQRPPQQIQDGGAVVAAKKYHPILTK
jgi:hypothetical protein